jgi:dienelactone hydrolase
LLCHNTSSDHHKQGPIQPRNVSLLMALYYNYNLCKSVDTVIRMRQFHLTFATLVLMASGLGQAQTQRLSEESLRIPMPEAGSMGLEAFMVRPDDSGPHPLALITHGAPREAARRADITALTFVPQSREFARRGWTTVVVVRRGYGTSGGHYAEDGRACSPHPDYYDSGKESAKDLRASIAYLSTLPQVDASRILSVGISAGGFANVALTANPPPGLLAAISFAGGRGSRKPDEVCNPDDLVRAFDQFGTTSRVPMLWVYAENDHFFAPQLAARFYQAFTRSGGRAVFIREAAFRRDGHELFSNGGIPIWTPVVDEFLARQNLRLREGLLALPVAPDVAAPSSLSIQGRQEWRNFLTFPAHRAFAVSHDGHYGYSYGRPTDKEARQLALGRCEAVVSRGDRCEVVEDQVKADGNS